MTTIELDHAPVFEPFDSAEPTVRQLIQEYYYGHFSNEIADRYITRYLKLMELKQECAPGTCPYNDWKPGKET